MPDAARPSTFSSRALPVVLYFSSLTILLNLCSPSGTLLDLATAYMLQIRLHASALQVSFFRLVTGLPLYGALVFGLMRDLWSPLGLRDRGYLRVFAVVAVSALVWLATTDLTYGALTGAVFLLGCAFMLMIAAQQGLMALVAQERLMSGRLAALYSFCAFLPFIVGAFFAGAAVEHLTPREIFATLAILTALIGGFSYIRPRSVFEHVYDQPAAICSTLSGDLRRFVRHRAVYPAVAMMFFWQFAPAQQTVLQYYLVDELHAPASTYGYWTGSYYIAFLPAFFVYGYLCQRMSFGRLGACSLFLSIPTYLLLPMVHSSQGALWLALPLGLMNGAAFSALWDVAIRSCPPGLQGTLMMAVAGANNLGWRVGDVFGTWLYKTGGSQGFAYCAVATALTSTLSLFVLLLVPRSLRSTADGEAISDVTAAGVRAAGIG